MQYYVYIYKKRVHTNDKSEPSVGLEQTKKWFSCKTVDSHMSPQN